MGGKPANCQLLPKNAVFQMVGQFRREGYYIRVRIRVDQDGASAVSISGLLHAPAHGRIAEFLAVEKHGGAFSKIAGFFDVDRFDGFLSQVHFPN